MTSSPTAHIDPTHPVLDALFGKARSRRIEDIEPALTTLFERFKYHPVRGRSSFEEIAQRVGNTTGREHNRLVLNCYDFSCLFTAHLRASGWRPDEVFAMPCDVLNEQGATAEHFHCCVLLRREGVRVIDPVHAHEPVIGKEAVERRYRIHMLFNDHGVQATKEDKARLLEPAPPQRRLRCFLYGEADPAITRLIKQSDFKRLVGDLFPKSTDPEISAATTGAGVVDALSEAQRLDLLSPGVGGVRPGRRLVAISRSAEATLKALIEPRLSRYSEIVSDAATSLRRDYDATEVSGQHEWSEVEHALVAGVLMDLAIGNRVAIAAQVRENQGKSLVWCFENLQADNSFGVQLFSSPPSPSFLFQLWHHEVSRPRLSLSPALVGAIERFARGERQAMDPKHWQYLRMVRLATGSRDAGRLRVPVLLPDAAERLGRTALDAGQTLVDEVLIPTFDDVLNTPGWPGGAVPSPGAATVGAAHMRPAIVRAMLEYATDRVITDGVLAPFPTQVPTEAWGRVLWLEPAMATDPIMPQDAHAEASHAESSRAETAAAVGA